MPVATIDIDELLEWSPNHNGGQVVVRAMPVTVQRIVGLHLEGRSAADIAASFTHVSIAAVHAALSFYYQHKEALDEEDRMAAAAAGAFAGEHGHETL